LVCVKHECVECSENADKRSRIWSTSPEYAFVCSGSCTTKDCRELERLEQSFCYKGRLESAGDGWKFLSADPASLFSMLTFIAFMCLLIVLASPDCNARQKRKRKPLLSVRVNVDNTDQTDETASIETSSDLRIDEASERTAHDDL
jgi:hypothetical protein